MFYRRIWAIISVLRRLAIRIKYVHRERLQLEGAYILCANHTHALDPFLIALGGRRQVHFMAKAELFKNWFLRKIILALGSFKVDRDVGDVSAIKQSLKLLKQGELLCIFPEGTREREAEMLPFHNGMAMIAMRAGVKVVPIGIAGKYRLWGKVAMAVGQPIDLSAFGSSKPSPEELAQATTAIQNAVGALVQEAKTNL